jgi:mannose-1-phosphate guanylyltransferase/mannose-6-phosphate isomerase
MQVHAVILCGGSGTRLWPLSTPTRPKQLLSLMGPLSMVAATAARLPDALSLTAVGSDAYAEALISELPGARVILEPFGRNSAPAVAAVCLTRAPEDLILILPADHHIADVAAFRAAITLGAEAARAGDIVTFGVRPDFPATGYGYIETTGAVGTAAVLQGTRFVEKPAREVAEGYLASGRFVWNAGIFLFRNSVMLDALAAHAPEVLAGVRAALQRQGEGAWRLDPAAFAATPSISIDYAVMERLPQFGVVPVDIGWNDVGDYLALHAVAGADGAGNTLVGPVVAFEASGNHVRSTGPRVAVAGVSGLAVVATPDAVMVAKLGDASAIKTLGERSARLPPDPAAAAGVWPEQRAWVREWLVAAFERWAQIGWDEAHGGFVEAVSHDGVQLPDIPRRARVQPRQVYSFAVAGARGWLDPSLAKRRVEAGLAYILERLRRPEGGFGHLQAKDGSLIDPLRDTYNHAFLLLAGAAARQHTGSPLADVLIREALATLDGLLAEPSGLGFQENERGDLPRRSNPHMHLLEAFLALHAADPTSDGLARAGRIVDLVETRLFDPLHNTIREYYDADLRPAAGPAGEWIEAGHHYEWVTLLAAYDALTGRDLASLQRRLMRTANAVRCQRTGWAVNGMRLNGQTANANRRLWPQLEMLRAAVAQPSASLLSAGTLLERIRATYLRADAPGLWWDEVDADGRPLSQNVPASMLYHMVTGLGPLAAE